LIQIQKNSSVLNYPRYHKLFDSAKQFGQISNEYRSVFMSTIEQSTVVDTDCTTQSSDEHVSEPVISSSKSKKKKKKKRKRKTKSASNSNQKHVADNSSTAVRKSFLDFDLSNPKEALFRPWHQQSYTQLCADADKLAKTLQTDAQDAKEEKLELSAAGFGVMVSNALSTNNAHNLESLLARYAPVPAKFVSAVSHDTQRFAAIRKKLFAVNDSKQMLAGLIAMCIVIHSATPNGPSGNWSTNSLNGFLSDSRTLDTLKVLIQSRSSRTSVYAQWALSQLCSGLSARQIASAASHELCVCVVRAAQRTDIAGFHQHVLDAWMLNTVRTLTRLVSSHENKYAMNFDELHVSDQHRHTQLLQACEGAGIFHVLCDILITAAPEEKTHACELKLSSRCATDVILPPLDATLRDSMTVLGTFMSAPSKLCDFEALQHDNPVKSKAVFAGLSVLIMNRDVVIKSLAKRVLKLMREQKSQNRV
jgi:hypothetical protein